MIEVTGSAEALNKLWKKLQEKSDSEFLGIDFRVTPPASDDEKTTNPPTYPTDTIEL